MTMLYIWTQVLFGGPLALCLRPSSMKSVVDIGLTTKETHEARMIRDA